MAAPGSIRPAASVVLLRDSPAGPQVLLMRRPERDNDFRSGACVFPGGVVDAGDADLHRWCFGLDDGAASRRLGLPGGGLDYFAGALRECFEEVGLLFVCAADGSPVDLGAHADALHGWRTRLHRGETTLGALCEAFGWRLDLREMAYLSHWLTPAVRPKRFDTRFFVRLAPAGQQARPDFGEALELMWLTPAEALDAARGLKLLNVTRRTLDDLRPFGSARAAFDAALARRGVARVLPRAVKTRDGRERFVVDGQPGYDEVARLDPEGRGTVPLELEPGDVTRLSPRLLRVAGARRHAYVVTGSAGGEAAIVDADPQDEAQLAALEAAVQGAVHWLLSLTAVAAGDTLRPLQTRWPRARVEAIDRLAADQAVDLGHDARLRVVAAGGPAVLLLEQEATLLVGDSIARPETLAAAGGAEWVAGARGFLQRLTGG